MIDTKKLALAAALAACLPAMAADYSVIGLGFEDLTVFDSSLGETPSVLVGNFYDGGFSMTLDGLSNVRGPGPVFGVAFNAAAEGIVSRRDPLFGSGNFGPRWLEGTDPAVDAPLANVGDGALKLTDDVVLNVAAGFNNGLSFYYASNVQAGSVTVFSGLGGTGTPLGSIGIGATTGCTLPNNSFCSWAIGSTPFAGVAHSARFTGVARLVLFDNVTFGDVVPIDGFVLAPVIPEPGTYALMALGLAAIGVAARRRRQR